MTELADVRDRLRQRVDQLTDERDEARARAEILESQLLESRNIARQHYNRARKLQRTLNKLTGDEA